MGRRKKKRSRKKPSKSHSRNSIGVENTHRGVPIPVPPSHVKNPQHNGDAREAASLDDGQLREPREHAFPKGWDETRPGRLQSRRQKCARDPHREPTAAQERRVRTRKRPNSEANAIDEAKGHHVAPEPQTKPGHRSGTNAAVGRDPS